MGFVLIENKLEIFEFFGQFRVYFRVFFVDFEFIFEIFVNFEFFVLVDEVNINVPFCHWAFPGCKVEGHAFRVVTP